MNDANDYANETVGDPRYAKPSLRLEFVEVACTKAQPRFAGRSMLKPLINLDDFRFRAVIDWVDVRITLKQVTQFQYVQKEIKAFVQRDSWITPINPGEGGETNTFDFRIQEPSSIAQVSEICNAVFSKFLKASAPTITGIEISVDAYPDEPSDDKRALLSGVIQRTIFSRRDITTDSNDRARSIVGADSISVLKLIPDAAISASDSPSSLTPSHYKIPWIDGTFYLGGRDNDVMIKVMDKVIDQQNRRATTVRILDDHEKRVRIEVTLKGSELNALGIVDLAGMKALSFGKLQGRYFQFKLPTFKTKTSSKKSAAGAAEVELDRRRAETFLMVGNVGVDATNRARASFHERMMPEVRRALRSAGRKIHRSRQGGGGTGSMIAYEALNICVANALRHLGEREKTAWAKAASCDTDLKGSDA